MFFRLLLLAAFFIILGLPGHSQSKSKLKLTGAIQVSLMGYQAEGIPARRPSPIWRISGRPSLQAGKWRIPLMLSLSNLGTQFSQPFNRLGIRPSRDWATFHLGYSRMNWSRYTLQRRAFFGLGVELNPGIVRLGAVYGRFRKSIDVDTLIVRHQARPYDRWGYGLKLGLGKKQNYVDLILFKGWDDTTKLEPAQGAFQQAAENLVLGITTQQKFAKYIRFEGEYTLSAFSRNRLSRAWEWEGGPSQDLFKNLFQPRFSTQVAAAGRASIVARSQSLQAELTYERIEPGYQSMGTFFFAQDLERITTSLRLSLARQTLQLFGRVGLQRNNLQQAQFANTRQVVGSANLSWVPNRAWQFLLQYSNLQLNQQIIQDVFTDTVRIAQVNQNGLAMLSYRYGSSERVQQVSLQVGFQELNSQDDVSQPSTPFGHRFARLQYKLSWTRNPGHARLGLVLNQQEIGERQQDRRGILMGLGQSMLEKRLTAQLQCAWFEILEKRRLSQRVLRPGLSLRLAINKKHSLTASAWYQRSVIVGGSRQSVSESFGQLSYRWRFR